MLKSSICTSWNLQLICYETIWGHTSRSLRSSSELFSSPVSWFKAGGATAWKRLGAPFLRSKKKGKSLRPWLCFFRFFVITYTMLEKPRETLRMSDPLCAVLAWVANGELQDLTPKWPWSADRFESNWSGQTMQTPDGLEVLAKLWRSTWEKSDVQSPA